MEEKEVLGNCQIFVNIYWNLPAKRLLIRLVVCSRFKQEIFLLISILTASDEIAVVGEIKFRERIKKSIFKQTRKPHWQQF